MNKIDFVVRIKNLVSNASLDIALDLLEENINRFDSNLYVDVLMLRTQYNASKNDYLIRSILDRSEYDKIIARVNLAILYIIDRIKDDKKFDKNRDSGKLLYKIPHQMTLNSETRCCVRIAYLEDIIRRDLDIDDETNIQSIKITEVMNVGLVDMNNPDVFQIRTVTDEEQFILKEDFTEWLFWVKPIREGCFNLLLKLAIVEQINEKERKRNIVLEKEIAIINKSVDNSKIGFEESKHAFIFLFVPKSSNISKEKLIKKYFTFILLVVSLGLFYIGLNTYYKEKERRETAMQTKEASIRLQIASLDSDLSSMNERLNNAKTLRAQENYYGELIELDVIDSAFNATITISIRSRFAELLKDEMMIKHDSFRTIMFSKQTRIDTLVKALYLERDSCLYYMELWEKYTKHKNAADILRNQGNEKLLEAFRKYQQARAVGYPPRSEEIKAIVRETGENLKLVYNLFVGFGDAWAKAKNYKAAMEAYESSREIATSIGISTTEVDKKINRIRNEIYTNKIRLD